MPCCISHEFLASAAKFPSRVAVVSACGGLQLFRDSLTSLREASPSSSSTPALTSGVDLNFDAAFDSSSPRLFPDDECFTYENLLSAVDILSHRIRFALDGGEDTNLVRPPGYVHILPDELEIEAVDEPGPSSKNCMPHIVGVLIGPSVEYIVAVLSILRCGEAFLPLDPLWPEERIVSIVSSSKASLVVKLKSDCLMRSGGQQLDGFCTDWIINRCGCSVFYFSMKEKIVKSTAHATNFIWPCEISRPRKFCYLMYTSGSTGTPKGICGKESGLVNRYCWMQNQFPILQEDVLLFKTPISFVDHIQEFLSAVLARALLIIPPYKELNIENTIFFLKAYRITRLTAIPSLMRELLPCLDVSQSARYLKSLKVLVLSGEILSISLWKALRDCLPETTILNLYGSTEAFLAALPVKEISDDDDFFIMGGNSISAAHAAYYLGIDMRMLYLFPSPFKLLNALLDQKQDSVFSTSYNVSEKKSGVNEILLSSFGRTMKDLINSSMGGILKKRNVEKGVDDLENFDTDHPISVPIKNKYLASLDDSIKVASSLHCAPDIPLFFRCGLPQKCSFSRSNQILLESEIVTNSEHSNWSSLKVSRHGRGHLKELWKVSLGSCVDASPLVIVKDGNVDVFIGSHSQIFLCIDALSGLVRWQVFLEGRIECSAAITGDFSQVVVGCYEGKIYFLDYSTGSKLWTFQTSGEVKMQPVVDRDRGLVWCGSHDHHLYALDYKRYCCSFNILCGGSIYGSPAIDKDQNMLYVASTSGLVSGVSLNVSTFGIKWRIQLDAPVFGSLCLDPYTGYVFCCSVDGNVIAVNPTGHTVWKVSVGGPIFAGACISYSLPSQLLICARTGGLYSIDTGDGTILWDYHTGDPITASTFVDEQCCVQTNSLNEYHRLACVCTSSGKMHVLRINPNAKQMRACGAQGGQLVEEFAVMDLPGDVFSSPVMIGGCIFVGCRDDYVHCFAVVT